MGTSQLFCEFGRSLQTLTPGAIVTARLSGYVLPCRRRRRRTARVRVRRCASAACSCSCTARTAAAARGASARPPGRPRSSSPPSTKTPSRVSRCVLCVLHAARSQRHPSLFCNHRHDPPRQYTVLRAGRGVHAVLQTPQFCGDRSSSVSILSVLCRAVQFSADQIECSSV